MNIQRYALPMIVAAGFHSALFLMTPDTSAAHGKPVDKPPYLPPIPENAIAMEDLSDPSDDVPLTQGGPSVPVIPDIAIESLEKPVFTVATVENLHPEKITTTNLIPSTMGNGDIGGVGPGVGPRFFSAVGLDRHPRATAQMSPDYPLSLHQQGIRGSVTVEFDVDTVGRVVRAEAVNYTRREFVEPALRAVRNWRFEPGKRQGKVVPFRMTVPIEFTIDS